jgi:hypothetical protein
LTKYDLKFGFIGRKDLSDDVPVGVMERIIDYGF